ncbi:MAG: Nif3-like dinuclear metal center hexameric protein [Leadbetterella sp.]
MKLKELTNFLETWAPLAYQEDYDNSGLLVGDHQAEILGVLVSLDVTIEVIEEAIQKKVNVVVAHHPLIFRGIKKIQYQSSLGAIIFKAIQNGIHIYAIHTNLDNIIGGVNTHFANRLGLLNQQILRPKTEMLDKLTVFVPKENSESLRRALFEAGAGSVGQYSECSFSTEGKGTFLPLDGSNPTLGQIGRQETVSEEKIEVVFPKYLTSKVLKSMFAAHPYEEVAYFHQSVENALQTVGSGIVGDLDVSMSELDFLTFLKKSMGLNVIKHTQLLDKNIERVAVCGGAGGFLLQDAIRSHAQVFITSDYKYHEYFDADKSIVIADIGHFESEQYTKDLIVSKISKKFTNFASYLSEVNTNPVNYFY